MAEHRAATIVAEKEWLLYPLGLPGTAVCGPAGQACPAVALQRRRMVWEAGGEIPLPTRLFAFSEPRRGGMIIAPGKATEAAARGKRPPHPASFFPSGLARLWRAKPEGKKEEIILRP